MSWLVQSHILIWEWDEKNGISQQIVFGLWAVANKTDGIRGWKWTFIPPKKKTCFFPGFDMC